MKKIIFSAIAMVVASTTLFAQDQVKVGAYDLKKVVDNKTTSVKNQASSGTCWAYGTIAMIESDIIKMKGDQFADLDLSELYVARNSYYDRFVKYVRLHGNINFAEGGSFMDVTDAIDRYGIVPQEVYQGLNYGYDMNVFGEVWEALQGYAQAIIKNKNSRLSTAWQAGFNAILDAYFGVCPKTFMYKGKEYTPKSFADYLGFKKSDYITFCSVTHVPYGSKHIMELPDNWIWGESVNVPMKELSVIQEEVLRNGYTTGWDADVSTSGFSHGEGLCVFTATKAEDVPGNEMDKWQKMQKDGKTEYTAVEREVTTEKRQLWYDNYLTEDDHCMQISGIYKDQNGGTFYKVKNSWAADSNEFGGFFYTSKAYFDAKTLYIMLNKNSLSDSTKKKYGIE
ncbi:MAG: C1 family peptidase [Rikenellaceae bacterium]